MSSDDYRKEIFPLDTVGLETITLNKKLRKTNMFPHKQDLHYFFFCKMESHTVAQVGLKPKTILSCLADFPCTTMLHTHIFYISVFYILSYMLICHMHAK